MDRKEMTSGTAKVTSKGQITLPASVRAEYQIAPGDLVVFFRDLDGRPMFKVRRMSRDLLRPVKKWTGKPKTDAEIDEATGQAVVEDFRRADRDSRPAQEKRK